MVEALKEELLKKSNYLNKSEILILIEAINFAEMAHQGQKRATGEPYITHPLAVCAILLDYQADSTSLVSALLHDVVEDTDVSITEIEQKFGTQVSNIVEGLTKVKKGKLNKEEYSAINTEKLLSAAVKDIRVAVIKIADRLHNMRTLTVKKVEKKVPYANETLIFFSPLAERLGLYKLQEELEEISFGYLNPPKFTNIKKLLRNYATIFEEIVHNCSKQIKEVAGKLVTDLQWGHIPLYTSYSLLQDDKDLSALFYIKIITNSTIDCYTALGIVHGLYPPLPHQMTDHIALALSPFLKQINTKVLVNNIEVNFIIQSEKDRKLNELGVFGFLSQDLTVSEVRNLSVNVLGESIKTAKHVTKTPVEYEEVISYELLQKKITVFTPRMDVIVLPEGATIIDFAFSLNTHLAKRMFKAKVNGELKDVHAVLNDMDIIELLVAFNNTVSADWLNHVRTSKAMKEIAEVINDD